MLGGGLSRAMETRARHDIEYVALQHIASATFIFALPPPCFTHPSRLQFLPVPFPSLRIALLQTRAEQTEAAQQQLAEARSEVSALQRCAAADAAAIVALRAQLAEVTELHAAVSERLEVSQAEAAERLSSLRAKDEFLVTLRVEITDQV